MENRIIFREMLTEIKKAADAADGVLTKAEVRSLLSGLPLEEEHFQFIYDYLAEQKIRVVESKENPETPDREESGEDGAEGSGRSLALYLEELEALGERTQEEEAQLLLRIREGDEQARESLIAWYLPLICRMAEEYDNGTLPAEDLIQEGNMGLLSALQSLADFESPAACSAHIWNSIREAMEAAAGTSREYQELGAGLVSRVNHLNEAIHNLERDLGRKVSAEELSAYLEMPLEEIRSLLYVAGDQIEL